MKKNQNYHFLLRPVMLFLIIIMISAVAMEINTKKAAAAPDSTLYFDLPTQTVGTNQDFALAARINPATNQVTAVEVHVTFDPNRFRLDSISNATSPFSNVLQDASINNTNGTASIIVGVPAANPPVPVTSTALVATFNFHSLGSVVTNSAIAFTNGSMAAAIGESGDVVITRTPAAITITGITYGNSEFAALVSDWLQTGSSPADVNSDNVVNSRDIGIMMSNWQ